MKKVSSRKVLGVMAGVITGILGSGLSDSALWKLLLYTNGINEAETPTFIIAVPFWNQVLSVLLQPIAVFAGCSIATFVSKSHDKSPTIAASAILLGLYTINQVYHPQPSWVYFLTLVGFVPAAMAGFAMGKKLQEFDRM